MRLILALPVAALSLCAQPPASPLPGGAPSTPVGQTLADEPEAPRPELQPFTAPKNPGIRPEPPIVEPTTPFTGSLDAGYRWISGIGGNMPTYRSVINLGEGPKLFGADFLLRDPKRRLYDRLGIRVSSVGGEPYSSVQVNARRERTYELIFNFKNIAYYNFLPQFADPLASINHTLLDEQSRDLFLRNSSLTLNVLPQRHFIPFLGYDRSSVSGSGIVTIVETSNEYPVLAGISTHANDIHGGIRVEYDHWHLTLEQGGIFFRGVQNNSNSSNPNYGNLGSTFLGQTLFLSSGTQSYLTHADSTYSQGILTATPFPWLDITGQFMFSQPAASTRFGETITGNIFDRPSFQFYAAQTSTISSQSLQPHTSGGFSAEIRPMSWLRILEAWSTDRLHSDGSAIASQQFTTAGGISTSPMVTLNDGILQTNYNRQELDLLFDPVPSLTIRAGYRYEWGNALAPLAFIGEATGVSAPFETAALNRNTVLAGLSYRWKQKLTATADIEGAPGNHVYFRTSLYDYQSARLRARYQILPALQLNATFNSLTNSNPNPLIQYHLTSRQTSFGLNWLPNGGKRVSIFAEYTYGTLDSAILFLVPSTLQRANSLFQDTAHTGVALIDTALGKWRRLQPRLTAGGALYYSVGDSATRYYQPFGRFLVGYGEHFATYVEWRWYNMAQPVFPVQAFRSNQLIFGIRASM
jgi:hypothetical protein